MQIIYWLCLFLAAACYAELPARSLWPNKVTLQKDIPFEQIVPNGKIKHLARSGCDVELVNLTEQGAVVRYKGVEAKVQICDTNFLACCQKKQDEIDAAENERITKIRQERDRKESEEKELAARQAWRDSRINEEKARPPVFKRMESGDLVMPEGMEREIKRRLKDPDSLQIRELIDLKLVDRETSICWEVKLKYGAKNSFGGYSTGVITAWVKQNRLIDLTMSE